MFVKEEWCFTQMILLVQSIIVFQFSRLVQVVLLHDGLQIQGTLTLFDDEKLDNFGIKRQHYPRLLNDEKLDYFVIKRQHYARHLNDEKLEILPPKTFWPKTVTGKAGGLHSAQSPDI